MPLDGGRYIDVLFINNRCFRFVFSLLGAAVLLLLGYTSNDFIIAIIGLSIIFSSYTNLKTNGISHHLKKNGVNASSLNELGASFQYLEITA
jgi:hypothetical protein